MGSLTDFKKKYGIPVYEKEAAPASSKTEKPDSLKKFMKRHGAIDYQERAIQKQKELVDSINKKSAPFVKTPQTPSEKSFDAVGKAHNAAAWSAQQAIYAAKEDRRKAGQTEIRQLEQELRLMETELEHYQNNTPMDWRSTTDRQAYTKGYEDRKAAISAKQAELNRARHMQEGYELSAVGDPASELYDPQFDQLSKYVPTAQRSPASSYNAGYEDPTYDLINTMGQPSQSYAQQGNTDDRTDALDPHYAHLTKDEIAIYNYYYAKDRKKARQYLESLQEELDDRANKERFKTMKGDLGEELLFAAESGIDRYATGFVNLTRVGDDYIPPARTQSLSQMVREDLADDGFKLPEWMGGASLGQTGFDAINSISYVLPSTLTSMAAEAVVPGSGAVVGRAMMGGSIFGNAYSEMVNMGYTPTQATNYAALASASEVFLQSLMGGISSLGGTLPKEAAKLLLDKVDHAIARAAITLSFNSLGELSEEYLQNVLEPWFQNIALQTQNDIDLISGEALYEGLLGALTSLFMEAPGTIHQEHIRSQNTAQKSEAIPSPGGKVPEGRKGNGETSQAPSATLGPLPEGAVGRADWGSVPTGSDVGIGPNAAPTTPLDPATLMDETIAQLRGAPADPIAAALDTIRSGGTVSNRQASDILANANAVQQLVQQTGMTLPDTASGKRAAVKDALATLATRHPLAPPLGELSPKATEGVPPVTITPTVDTAPKISHNNKNETGGTDHARTDNNGLSGTSEAGLPGGTGDRWLRGMGSQQVQLSGQAPGEVEAGSYMGPGSVETRPGGGSFEVQLRISPVLRVSDRLQSAQTARGTKTYAVRDTTTQPQTYADALTAGRNSDTANGWCVTPKSAQDLSSDGVRTVMNDTGTVGAGIAPNGDIVAVFKNKNGGPPRALDTLMPIIIEQGGDRLDCYGEGLVRAYENYGFIPVARVEFNSEYANEGWNESKGHPWIYFMIHNGDTAEQVASKIGTYPHMSIAQLEALPTYGKEDYDSAMAYRDNLLPDRSDVPQRNEASKDLPQASTAPLGSPSGGAGTAQATPSSDDGGDFPTSPLESSFGPNTVGSAQSAFEYKEKTSGLYENTYENATSKDVQAIGSEAQSRDPRIGLYAVETEAESLFRAKQRTATEEDIDWEYDDLMDRDNWNGEDNDTAMRVLDHLLKSGDLLRFDELADKQRERATSSAQMTQSFAKYTRQTTTATAVEAMGKVNELSEHDIQKRAYKKQGFDQWQQDLKQTILDLANQIDGVTTGDVVSMREVIRALAQFRRTTAWMGCSSKLTKIADSALGTLDFETLKAVANAQLSMIPEDFRRRSVGQIVRTIRIHNMLSSLATVNRNAIGNVGGGLVDGFSDSTVGRGLDVLVSLATGKRTVGNDIIHGKTYLSAATKAAKMAAMCVELDIPMDSESRFSVGYTRTHSPQRGIIGRFLSAYEKVMRHALEVSDQFFEGGSAGAVRKSLEDLGAKSGLTDDEISAVAGKVGKRRTYKDDRKLTRGAKLIKRGLDEFGSDELGLGDLVMPFTGTSSNLGQTAVDYSGAGVFTGLYEIMKLIRDVRRGDYEGGSKTTTHRGQSRTVTLVEAQRQAVTNAARGITGAGLVAAFAAMALTGIIRVHDDEDKDARALDQSQDLSGAQFNVDAMLRAFNGEDTAWQTGDHTVTIDFLEPFNAQMYIGYILSQEETVADMLKAYPGASLEGIVRSILDMPMMQGLSETADLISGIGRSLEEGDEVSDWGSVASDVGGQLLGSTGTSFIPAWLRQSAYMADPYYRDTTGDDPMEKAINQIKSNIPGLSTTLPMKYSGLGEEQRRHEGGISGFFNTFVNPGKISTIDISNIAAAVDRISEATGNVAIYPEDKAPASFTYDGTTVTISGKDMTETYQRTYGESVADLYGELISSEDFQSLPAADQASVLEKAKTYATHLARASVSDYNKVPAYIAEKGKGVSEASAILRHHVASIISDAFTSLTDAWKNGTSADASVSKLNEVYDTLQALPTKTRAAITKELTGRQAAFVEAKKAGLTTESFTDLYRQYRDIEATSKTASQKAQDWSHALELSRSKGQISTKQRDILKDKLYFADIIPQDADKYDRMVAAGIPAKKADYVTDLLANIPPEPGYTTVRPIQQMEAIVSDRSLTSYTDDLLHVLLDDKADEQYDRSRALGLEADECVQLYRHYLDDRKKASFLTFCKNELSLSTSTAETLYKIWSGKA